MSKKPEHTFMKMEDKNGEKDDNLVSIDDRVVILVTLKVANKN